MNKGGSCRRAMLRREVLVATILFSFVTLDNAPMTQQEGKRSETRYIAGL